ncbi:MAG: membrane dipeptidase [Myxococcota bacterium]|jgi:microsomal dipeptidase-like Zn-dependent dipeptidase|nr:membrane dipeptidase [Myxococcota bacterium]
MRAVVYVAVGLLVLVGAFLLLGLHVERFINRVADVDLPEASARARTLHAESFVVDLHTDSTMTGRDLFERSNVGHVDFPRLREGGVGLQFFTAPTKVPFSGDVHHTSADDPDLLTLLGIARRDGFGRAGPFRRGVLQGDVIREAVERAPDELMLVRTREDLETLLLRREENPKFFGALLGLEGAHALEANLENLERFAEGGVRMIGITHFFDNAFAGSAHGIEKGGLSQLGRDLVARMIELGIMIDIAHLAPKAIDELFEIIDVPVVVSHTGVKGTCDNPRNLSDEHVRKIAQGGGVIGIGYWEMAVCGIRPADIVVAMDHVIGLVGDTHVALGSDYDGAVTTAFDTSGLPVLTQAMLDAGYGDERVKRILGGNILRVMREVLPSRTQ